MPSSITAGPTYPAFAPIGKHLAVAYASLAIATTDLTLNTVLDAVRLPKGARVHEVVLTATDLDTNGTPTLALAVGDAALANRFINGAAVGQTAGAVRAGNDATAAANLAAHTAYAAETVIQVKVTTAAATAAAGTIVLAVFYSGE